MTEETHCPSCGLAYAMVGRAHNCRPRHAVKPVSPRAMDAVGAKIAKTKQSITQKPDMQAFAGFPPEPCSNCAQLEAEVERLKAIIAKHDVDITVDITKPVDITSECPSCAKRKAEAVKRTTDWRKNRQKKS